MTNYCVVVDVMLVCRRLQWKKMNTFKDFADVFCKTIMFKKNEVNRTDFVFYCYLDMSPKSSEILLRYGKSAIEMYQINENIRIPVQEDKFWASTNNKILLQNFLREYIFHRGQEFWPGIELICSNTNKKLCLSSFPLESSDRLTSLQRQDIEEADSRIIIHVEHAINEGTQNILVLSSDTDVLVLLLYFWGEFEKKGLKVINFN